MTVERYEIDEQTINFSIGFINDYSACPHCQQKTDEINQKRLLSVRDLPILGKATILEIERRQYYCKNCNKYFTEPIDFIDFDRHSTQRYKQYIYERVKKADITQVAREESLTYDKVKSIFENQFSKKKSFLLQRD